VRVIAGTAKGRKLRVPGGLLTRPTPSRVREALFSILQQRIELTGARVLDLFAGSGALGIEALSRGAASATFVDLAGAAQQALRHNLAPFAQRARLLPESVQLAIEHLSQPQPPARPPRFDLIFLDPPYAQNLLPESLEQLAVAKLLAPGGLLICEHAGATPPSPVPPAFAPVLQRRFGEVGLLVLGWAP
jgi:16S rRNA (guanine966-N2)-methyltransferase